MFLCRKEPTRTVATAVEDYAPKSGPDSVAVTTAPTPSPSTSEARNISSRRRSFSCPRKSGQASRIFWPANRPPKNHEAVAVVAVGFNDISVSSGRNQHVRVRYESQMTGPVSESPQSTPRKKGYVLSSLSPSRRRLSGGMETLS